MQWLLIKRQVKYINFVLYKPSHDFTTLSRIIAESFIILAKFFPFSQLHVAGFQT